MSPAQRFQLDSSDVITLHIYADLDTTRAAITAMRAYHRPLLCSECMARPLGSTFADILPLFKQEKIAAWNWGFVDGKSQTNPLGFVGEALRRRSAALVHDVLHGDGAPYDAGEAALIRHLTGKGP